MVKAGDYNTINNTTDCNDERIMAVPISTEITLAYPQIVTFDGSYFYIVEHTCPSINDHDINSLFTDGTFYQLSAVNIMSKFIINSTIRAIPQIVSEYTKSAYLFWKTGLA